MNKTLGIFMSGYWQWGWGGWDRQDSKRANHRYLIKGVAIDYFLLKVELACLISSNRKIPFQIGDTMGSKCSTSYDSVLSSRTKVLFISTLGYLGILSSKVVPPVVTRDTHYKLLFMSREKKILFFSIINDMSFLLVSLSQLNHRPTPEPKTAIEGMPCTYGLKLFSIYPCKSGWIQ